MALSDEFCNIEYLHENWNKSRILKTILIEWLAVF